MKRQSYLKWNLWKKIELNYFIIYDTQSMIPMKTLMDQNSMMARISEFYEPAHRYVTVG